MASKDMTMMLLLGGVAVVGGVVIFWDKICPVFNMCGANEKIGDMIKGGPDDAEEGEDEHEEGDKTDQEAPEKIATVGCCECGMVDDKAKCSRAGGPWTSYRSANRMKGEGRKMARAIKICNKHCERSERADLKRKGAKIIVKKKYDFRDPDVYDSFFAADNGRMSI